MIGTPNTVQAFISAVGAGLAQVVPLKNEQWIGKRLLMLVTSNEPAGANAGLVRVQVAYSDGSLGDWNPGAGSGLYGCAWLVDEGEGPQAVITDEPGVDMPTLGHLGPMPDSVLVTIDPISATGQVLLTISAVQA